MRKYHFKNCNELQMNAITELQRLLPFTISSDGICVELENTESGLAVDSTEEGYKIKFSSLHTLFRGIFLLYAKGDKKDLHITQECSFKDFGIMLDVSRNAVLKTETIKDIVLHLALLGYNSLQLYTEDTLEVENEEYFGYMRGALTGEEIKEIDNYCKLFGIELIPCIQTLAHLNQITRYERYDKIIDYADILLVGEERTYELLENIFKTASKHFTSRNINIGMDEAHMVGLGKYLDKNGYRNRFDIMLEHLKKVLELCDKYGFKPRMWSDMFFRLVSGGDYYNTQIDGEVKELFDKIPKEVKLIYWDYYSLDSSRYENNLKLHKKISDNVGFAGGAWKWTGFAPDNLFSIKTGEQSMKACKNVGTDSFLLTCWGDNGAEASVYSILPSIYYYAEEAYSNEFEKDSFLSLTGIDFDDFMKLDLPNRIMEPSDYDRNNASKFLLYNDLLIGTFDSLVFDKIDEAYEKNAMELKEICQKTDRYGYLFDTLYKLCDVLSLKAKLSLDLKAAYDKNDRQMLLEIKDAVLPRLISKLDSFYDSFFYQWHKENKSFGFEVQVVRLGGLKTRMEYVQKRIEQYLRGEILKIEELEIPRKPFSYFETLDNNKIIYNLWNVIVTPSVM
nr:beta-N-acetylhexosaminidase [uncultured Anaerocolumna sp.]